MVKWTETVQAKRQPSSEILPAKAAVESDVATHISDPSLDSPQNSAAMDTVQQMPTADRPYTIFTSKQKSAIVLMVTLGASFSPFSTSIYYPAISTIAQRLHVSINEVNLTVTTYMICQGIAPSVISAISDARGRRPAYVVGFGVYLIANLGLGLNNSYAGLLVLRCLQACGSSGLVTLAQGSIADIVTSAERGKYIAITSVASVASPALAPVAGGLLTQHLGWHSLFWFLLIMSAVYFVPLVLFFPETSRVVVGDGSVRPPKWNQCLTDKWRAKSGVFDRHDESIAQGADVTLAKKRGFNVFATLDVVSDPETAMILAFIAVNNACMNTLIVSFPVHAHEIYRLTPTEQGLLPLTQAVGALIAAVFNSKVIDSRYRVFATRAGVEYQKSRQIDILTTPMDLERARLQIAIPMTLAASCAMITFGWLLWARVSIAGPIVMSFFIACPLVSAFSATNVLLIDLHRSRSAATASAASNLTRCLLSAGATAAINPLIEAIGLGWTFTLIGLLMLSSLALALTVFYRGPHMRKARKAREDRKTTEKSRDNLV